MGKPVSSTSFTPSASTWYHVAGVHDATAGELRLYIDSALNNTAAVQPTVLTNNDSLIFGQRDNGSRPLNAKLDEVRITGRVLQPSELLFNNALAAPTVVFDDNFEHYVDGPDVRNRPPRDWDQILPGGGNVGLDTAHAHSGTQSGFLHINGQPSSIEIRLQNDVHALELRDENLVANSGWIALTELEKIQMNFFFQQYIGSGFTAFGNSMTNHVTSSVLSGSQSRFSGGEPPQDIVDGLDNWHYWKFLHDMGNKNTVSFQFDNTIYDLGFQLNQWPEFFGEGGGGHEMAFRFASTTDQFPLDAMSLHDDTSIETGPGAGEYIRALLPYSEDFDATIAATTAQQLVEVGGQWTQPGNVYRGEPSGASGNTFALVNTGDLEAAMASSDIVGGLQLDVTTNFRSAGFAESNGMVVFDYQDPNNFKYALGSADNDAWSLGHVTGGIWMTDVSFSETLSINTDYNISVVLDGTTVYLAVDGEPKLAFDYGNNVLDGQIGIGGRDSATEFDDLSVGPVVANQLPYSQDFDSGSTSGWTPMVGTWSLNSDTYEGQGGAGRAVSLLATYGSKSGDGPMPKHFDYSATVNMQTGGTVNGGHLIFDYQGPNDYKYAHLQDSTDIVVLGHFDGVFNTDASAAFTLGTNTNYTLSIEVDNETASVRINGGSSLVTHTYSGDPLHDGRVGAGNNKAITRFDDVSITESAAEIPYTEDFSGAIDDWNFVVGAVSQSGALDVGNSGQPLSLATMSSGALPTIFDYDVDVSFVNPSVSQVPQIIFDYRSPYDYKFVQLSDTGTNSNTASGLDRIRIGQRTRTAFTYLEELIVVPVYNSTGTYAVKVEVDGSTVKAHLDGVEKLSHTFSGPVNEGLLGVATRRNRSVFDNVRVSDPGTALFPYLEDFQDGVADGIIEAEGIWQITGGRYEGIPVNSSSNALAVIDFADSLPSDIHIKSLVHGLDAGVGFLDNALILFDYLDVDNYKFAGAFYGPSVWCLGNVTAGTIICDSTFADTVNLNTDYQVEVRLIGTTATLLVDNVQKTTFDFGESLTNGLVGVGTERAWSQFDNLTVARPPLKGDMNGDGLVNLGDVALFIQALTNPTAYAAAHPAVDADTNGDVDDSGTFDLGDNGPFSQLFAFIPSPGTTLVPVEDTWVRESSPTTNYDDDGISVWNNDSEDPASGRRWGIVEFDVSGLSLQSMTLDLWSQVWGFGDDDDPLKQSVAIIDISSTGKLVEQLVWNDVAGLAQTSLETLGTYDILDPDSDPNVPVYKSSVASVADIAAIQAIADGSGQLVILMMADDTGATNYSGTWGDSETTYAGGQPPQLLINGGAPASASASATASISAAVEAENESMDVTLVTVGTAQSLPESVSTSPMSFDSPSRLAELADAAFSARTFDDLLLPHARRTSMTTGAGDDAFDLVARATMNQASLDDSVTQWDESLLSLLEEDLE